MTYRQLDPLTEPDLQLDLATVDDEFDLGSSYIDNDSTITIKVSAKPNDSDRVIFYEGSGCSGAILQNNASENLDLIFLDDGSEDGEKIYSARYINVFDEEIACGDIEKSYTYDSIAPVLTWSQLVHQY